MTQKEFSSNERRKTRASVILVIAPQASAKLVISSTIPPSAYRATFVRQIDTSRYTVASIRVVGVEEHAPIHIQLTQEMMLQCL